MFVSDVCVGPLSRGLACRFTDANEMLRSCSVELPNASRYHRSGVALAGSGGEMPRGGQARQRIGQFVSIERLDQKAVHADLKAGVTIFHQRVRGQREDRRMAAG